MDRFRFLNVSLVDRFCFLIVSLVDRFRIFIVSLVHRFRIGFFYVNRLRDVCSCEPIPRCEPIRSCLRLVERFCVVVAMCTDSTLFTPCGPIPGCLFYALWTDSALSAFSVHRYHGAYPYEPISRCEPIGCCLHLVNRFRVVYALWADSALFMPCGPIPRLFFCVS